MLLGWLKNLIVVSPHAALSFCCRQGPYDILFKECGQCPEGIIQKPAMLNLTGNWRHSRAYNTMIFDGDLWIGMNVAPGDVGVSTDQDYL